MIIQVDCDEMEAEILTTYAKQKGMSVSDFLLGAALCKIAKDYENVGVHIEKTDEEILNDIMNSTRTKGKSKFWEIIKVLMRV